MPSYGSSYYQPPRRFKLVQPGSRHVLPSPPSPTANSPHVYPSFHEMNALYQGYVVGAGAPYGPYGVQLSGMPKPLEADYAGYGYGGYVAYPPVPNPYMGAPVNYMGFGGSENRIGFSKSDVKERDLEHKAQGKYST